MITINLDRTKLRPAIRIKTSPEENFLCLIDTGALISVWTQKSYMLPKSFPDVEKTNYVTTVSGFGGKSIKKREIWKIPRFVLKDRVQNKEYAIENLLVALVDNMNVMSYNMILSSLVFHGTSYHIFDDSSKKIEVYPKIDRPLVCVPRGILTKERIKELIPLQLELEEGEIYISGATVFYVDTI